MRNTVYQIVYKSCYHGEIYDDPRAVVISPPCPACDILEIVEIDTPGDTLAEKNRHQIDGGMDGSNFIGSYFDNKETAIKTLLSMN